MNRINLIGQKFGRLLVIACEGYFNGQSRWRCQCECGEIKINGSSNLRQGRVKSCGCFNREFKAAGGPNKRHGMFGTPTYNTWGGMKGRCYNPKNHKFPDYGGRGITVCDRWLTSFENFFADMGLKPQGKTIDRMENNGNYEPSNCRWATPIQQVHNRRPTSTHFRCAVNGFYGTLPEISRNFAISQSALADYVHIRKVPIQDAVDHLIKYRRKSYGVRRTLATP